jgi:hypothetical protein
VYPLIALVVAVLLLPSALRPPPEQTSDSAALNPNLPPEEQQEQVIQSIRQAQGGGAGAAQDAESSTTTTTAPARSQLAFGNCFGVPARQTESVYSAPCSPAFRGDNGGATGHNVFPNEVRLGFWHVVGAPSTAGKVPDTAQAGESAETRTFRVLEDYFNRRYQTWGRRVQFYALAGGADPAENQALVRQADSEYHLFGAYHLNRSFCEPFVRDVGPMMCNPERHEVYLRNRPNMFSFMMDRTQASGFGAEFLCKNIIGKPARFAGERLRGRARKVAVLTQNAPNRGISPEVQVAALKKECGASFNGGVYELDTDNDPSTAAALVTRMLADGVTSVVLETELINTLYVMTAAQSQGFVPEWMIFNANGLDFNGVAQLLPPSEAVHLFGLTAWEVPRRLEEQECYQAYRSIDPDNEPNANTCTNFWHPMVMLMNGIQQAGPKLSAKSFAQGLEAMGYRYPVEPWAIGGGYGPDDYSYMDNMSEIWFSGAAKAPENDQPGAFVWAYQAKRFKRGQIPTDDSELFRNGVTTPNGPQVG